MNAPFMNPAEFIAHARHLKSDGIRKEVLELFEDKDQAVAWDEVPVSDGQYAVYNSLSFFIPEEESFLHDTLLGIKAELESIGWHVEYDGNGLIEICSIPVEDYHAFVGESSEAEGDEIDEDESLDDDFEDDLEDEDRDESSEDSEEFEFEDDEDDEDDDGKLKHKNTKQPCACSSCR